jgi:hypothetical protein
MSPDLFVIQISWRRNQSLHIWSKLDNKQRQIVISPVEKPLAVSVDEDFARQVHEFIEEYRPTLEALAK